MNTCREADRAPIGAVCSSFREFLSLREVVTLADISEKRVRKDIETGVLAKPLIVRLPDARLCFEWRHVYVLAAVYGNALLSGSLRRAAVMRVDTLVRDVDIGICINNNWHHFECKRSHNAKTKFEIDKYVFLDFDKVCHNVRPRVDIYAHGLSRIEEKPDVLGGEAVFKGTRLSVSHIGKMLADGETAKNIVEDFPALNDYDVRFAELYYAAHPTIGRPKTHGGAGDVSSCA